MTNRIGWMIRGLALLACSAALALPALADQPGDAWITTKVKMALLTDDQVDGLDINVDTFDGRVTLHGDVASEAEKAAAGEEARQVEGVREVRNLIAVVPQQDREATEVADEKLSEQVSQALEDDPELEDSDIEVESVNDGVVVLSGDAKTLSAHQRALEDARGVEGVRSVSSQIRSPDQLADEEIWQDAEAETAGEGEGAMESAQGTVSDAWITTKAKLFLMTDPGLSPFDVNVDTRRGTVTLFGTVRSDEMKRRAESEVQKLDGVKSVENELQVVTDVAADRVEAKDDEVKESVEQRLEDREALSDLDIDIEVSNGVVRLTGAVPSQRDRLAALTVARATSGVSSVIDDLTLERQGQQAARSEQQRQEQQQEREQEREQE